MLQAANTDLFNPIVPKAQNCECQNLLVSSFKKIVFFAASALMS